MKSPAHSRIRGWLLGLSVAVNLWFWWHGSTASIPSQGSNESLEPSTIHRAGTSAGNIHKDLSTDPVREAWAAVASGDFVRMHDQLRAAGCPKKTVQEALLLAMARHYQNQALSVEGRRFSDPDYALKSLRMDEVDLARRTVNALRVELGHRYKNLLGVSLAEVRGQMGVDTEVPNDWLGDVHRKKLDELELRYEGDKMAISFGTSHDLAPLNAEQRRQLAELEERYKTELRSTLTPEEFQEYERRESEVANWVRQNVFPPAKDANEFDRMLAAVRAAGITSTGINGFDDPQEIQDRNNRDRKRFREAFELNLTAEAKAARERSLQEAVAEGMAEKAQADAEEMEHGLSGLRSETLQKLRTMDLGLSLQAVDRFADAELDFVKTMIEAKRHPVATRDEEAESSKQFEHRLFSLCEEHFGAQGAAVFAKLTGGTPSKP